MGSSAVARVVAGVWVRGDDHRSGEGRRTRRPGGIITLKPCLMILGKALYCGKWPGDPIRLSLVAGNNEVVIVIHVDYIHFKL